MERQFEAAHHNGPEHSRCHNNHGHTWKVKVELEYDSLDQYGWGPDFGVVKQVIDRFDHTDLNDYMKSPSAENVAVFLTENLNSAFATHPGNVRVRQVEVGEGGGNFVTFIPAVIDDIPDTF